LQPKEKQSRFEQEKSLIKVLEEIADAVFLVADSVDRLAQAWVEMVETSKKTIKAGAPT
jgi:hypothetical protein